VGPLIGGHFSNPTEQLPDLFGDSLFLKEYPYFLPCFIGAFVTFTGSVIAAFCLTETHVKKGRHNSHHHYHDTAPIHQSREGGSELTSGSNVTITVTNPSDEEASEDGNSFQSDNNSRKRLLVSTDYASNLSIFSPLERYDMEQAPSDISTTPTWAIFSVIFPYSILVLILATYEGFFNLWTLLPQKDGGLGFTLQENADLMSILGFCGLVIQLLFYPFAQSRMGTLNCYRLSVSLMLLVSFLFRIVPQFTSHKDTVWKLLLLLCMMRTIAITFGFTSCMLLVSAFVWTSYVYSEV
jgi:hypothetical protein